ncbi:interferon-induced transmembrane protein 1-like [Thalassophryne amazonica]|uniref:interferon-induced transmembrane protein 1-like n=1 Tax=Thalassophryne amazonica TaxID=390379 RepID=UPI0014724AF5|nr:interferon-induced transmembrane protein 1-like [Thalassophryne amazonica]
MNPHQYPEQAMPLQQGGTGGFPNQQGGPVLYQHTAVNISTELPKDHIVWSLCCFFYSLNSGFCCCLGLAALIFSVKARDRKMVGDLEGARHYGKTAAGINIASTILMSLLYISVFIAVIVLLSQANSYSNKYSHYG